MFLRSYVAVNSIQSFLMILASRRCVSHLSSYSFSRKPRVASLSCFICLLELPVFLLLIFFFSVTLRWMVVVLLEGFCLTCWYTCWLAVRWVYHRHPSEVKTQNWNGDFLFLFAKFTPFLFRPNHYLLFAMYVLLYHGCISIKGMEVSALLPS